MVISDAPCVTPILAQAAYDLCGLPMTFTSSTDKAAAILPSAGSQRWFRGTWTGLHGMASLCVARSSSRVC